MKNIKQYLTETETVEEFHKRLESDFQELEREDIRRREHIKHHVEQENRILEKLNMAKKKRDEMNDELGEVRESLPRKEKELADAATERERLKEAFRKLEDEVRTKTA